MIILTILHDRFGCLYTTTSRRTGHLVCKVWLKGYCNVFSSTTWIMPGVAKTILPFRSCVQVSDMLVCTPAHARREREVSRREGNGKNGDPNIHRRSLKAWMFDCCYMQDTESFVFFCIYIQICFTRITPKSSECMTFTQILLATICVMTEGHCIGRAFLTISPLYDFYLFHAIHVPYATHYPSCNHL